MLKLCMARPVATVLTLTLLTLAMTWFAVRYLTVEGDVARAIQGTSSEYRTHAAFEEQFGSPSRDEVLLVQAADFGDPDTFAALEDLVLSLQLSDGVRAVLSIFALPDPAGEGLSYLSRPDVADLPPAERLDRLRQLSPLAPYLISEDRSAALMTVLPDLSVRSRDRLAYLQQEFEAAAPALKVNSVSLVEVQREISAALISDQLVISPLATVVCVLIALLLFRSWRAALLCAVPSALGMAGTFAGMAALGVPFDPFMAIVPTLIIVLGIADSVHVFHAVLLRAKEMDAPAAIARGLRETMPAVILAALTTALAFGCLLLVGSRTLANVALIGPLAMAVTTVAVYVALPPACLLLFRGHALTEARPLEFRALRAAAVDLLGHNGKVVFFAAVALVALLYAQTQTVIGYRLMDHVPRNGEFRATIDVMNEKLPGSDQSFVLFSAADPSPGISQADREQLERAGSVLFGTGAGLLPEREGPEIDNAILRRFESADGTTFAVPLIEKIDRTWTEILASAEETKAALAEVGIPDARIAGHSLMTSVELPNVVKELRFAFYAAVAGVTLLAALLLGSVRIALLSLVPNIVPILGVEAWLVLADRPLTVTGGIAFTIAFGIAVDDTIHLLNRLRLVRGAGAPIDRDAIESALRATAGPILTTSLVLLAGFAVTAFSVLPSVSVFGQLTAAAMVLATIADLFLFPSLLCWGGIGARTR